MAWLQKPILFSVRNHKGRTAVLKSKSYGMTIGEMFAWTGKGAFLYNILLDVRRSIYWSESVYTSTWWERRSPLGWRSSQVNNAGLSSILSFSFSRFRKLRMLKKTRDNVVQTETLSTWEIKKLPWRKSLRFACILVCSIAPTQLILSFFKLRGKICGDQSTPFSTYDLTVNNLTKFSG